MHQSHCSPRGAPIPTPSRGTQGPAIPTAQGGAQVCSHPQCSPLPALQITVRKQDTCTLLSNAQPHKWKVLSGGGEAEVPSVCFILPPPNPEALDAVRR